MQTFLFKSNIIFYLFFIVSALWMMVLAPDLAMRCAATLMLAAAGVIVYMLNSNTPLPQGIAVGVNPRHMQPAEKGKGMGKHAPTRRTDPPRAKSNARARAAAAFNTGSTSSLRRVRFQRAGPGSSGLPSPRTGP